MSDVVWTVQKEPSNTHQNLCYFNIVTTPDENHIAVLEDEAIAESIVFCHNAAVTRACEKVVSDIQLIIRTEGKV